MKLTIVESPYAAPDPVGIERNKEYLKDCIADSLARGESPYASHALLTDVLDDTSPAERAVGINAGHAWMLVADHVAVYLDRGISPGMQAGIDAAHQAGLPIEYRVIEGVGV